MDQQRSNAKQQHAGGARHWGNALKRLLGIGTQHQHSEAAGYDAAAVQKDPGSEQNNDTGLGNPDRSVEARDQEPEPAAPQAINPNPSKAG